MKHDSKGAVLLRGRVTVERSNPGHNPLPVTDLTKPLETNGGVIYFDIDGDDMSLAIRKGETPLKVVEAWVERNLKEGKVELGSPGQLKLHFRGWTGELATTTTKVKIESRKVAGHNPVPRNPPPPPLELGDGRLLRRVKPGSKVTIVDRFGERRTGRAVMLGHAGWVLDMGGRYGTPGIANESNIIAVKP